MFHPFTDINKSLFLIYKILLDPASKIISLINFYVLESNINNPVSNADNII